jgi:hypothetical protein
MLPPVKDPHLAILLASLYWCRRALDLLAHGLSENQIPPSSAAAKPLQRFRTGNIRTVRAVQTITLNHSLDDSCF